MKYAANLLLAGLIGILVGALCGGAILSFAFLIAANKLAYWTPTVLAWGLLYGGLFGAIVVPVAYLLLLRKIGLRKPFAPALVGTLIGGFLGDIVGPPLAVLTGILGFFAGVAFAVWRTTHARIEESQMPFAHGHGRRKNQRYKLAIRLGFKLLGALFLIAVIFLYVLIGGIHRPALYKLPAGYQGWVVIQYEVPNCPQLKTEGLYIVIPIAPSGDGCTSSQSPLQVSRYTRYRSVRRDGSYTEIQQTGWGEGGRIWARTYAEKQNEIPYPQEQFFVGTEAELNRSWKDRPKAWNYNRP